MRTATFVVLAALTIGCSSTESDPPNQTNTTLPDGSLADMQADSGGVSTAYSYHRDIKPLIDGRCVNCHVEGGIGPFTLTTYDEVLAVKDLVGSVVHARTMPPFLPSPGCREYEYDPSLSPEQIVMVEDWVAGGAPEGDPADAVDPLYPEIPNPPAFDTTLAMAEPYTPTTSPDDYRCFVLDWPHDSLKYVTGFGVEPGEARMVHHVIAYLASPELADAADAKDAAEAGPGYSCFGGPSIGGEFGQLPWLGSWAPGNNGSKYAAGTGLPVEQGSKVVVQVHYNTLVVDPLPDTTKIRFETADTVDKPAFFRLWANPTWLSLGTMPIPAGDAAVMHSFSLDPTLTTSGRPLTFYGGGVHMHLLGSAANAYVVRQNGDTDCLLKIDNYDFSWQGGNGFKTPVTIQTGDRLVLECMWDNSQANQPLVNGVQMAPTDRNWGDGTTDEMCLGIFYATVD